MSRRLTWLIAAACQGLAGSVSAQLTNDLPQLAPPYEELPPGFWEQHGLTVIIGALFALAAVGIVAWLLLRPRPVPALPPEVQARRALAVLLTQPETDKSLSAASQILRRYFADAFDLGIGEATTQELLSAIEMHPRIPVALRQSVAELLHDCDTRKFASPRPAATTGTIPRVLQLIDQAEAARNHRPTQT